MTDLRPRITELESELQEVREALRGAVEARDEVGTAAAKQDVRLRDALIRTEQAERARDQAVEALRFYADESNYTIDVESAPTAAERDWGLRARKFLNESDDGGCVLGQARRPMRRKPSYVLCREFMGDVAFEYASLEAAVRRWGRFGLRMRLPDGSIHPLSEADRRRADVLYRRLHTTARTASGGSNK